MFAITIIVHYNAQMLAAEFGSRIRSLRLAKGWTQAALAHAANVSRTVLSRLEQGGARPVQTDVLDRLFAALESDARMPGDAGLESRRQARLEQRLGIEERRSRHLRLALQLAGDPRSAAQLVAKATRVVDLWRRKRTCSPFYIERWSQLLALPPAQLANRMASLGEWEDALFQNTPWSWAWN